MKTARIYSISWIQCVSFGWDTLYIGHKLQIKILIGLQL